MQRQYTSNLVDSEALEVKLFSFFPRMVFFIVFLFFLLDCNFNMRHLCCSASFCNLCRQDGTAQFSIFSSILRWFYCSISFGNSLKAKRYNSIASFPASLCFNFTVVCAWIFTSSWWFRKNDVCVFQSSLNGMFIKRYDCSNFYDNVTPPLSFSICILIPFPCWQPTHNTIMFIKPAATLWIW